MNEKLVYLLRRLGAFLIDMAAIACLLILIMPTNGLAGSALGGMISTLIITPALTLVNDNQLHYFIAFMIWILYSVFFESLFKTSIGKYIMQLEFEKIGDNFFQRFLISTTRNFLRIIPFNAISIIYAEKPFGDRILGCQLIIKNNWLSQIFKNNQLSLIKYNPTFENALKLLFVISTMAVLILMLPARPDYDNKLEYNVILLLARYLALVVFGLISYRLFMAGERHVAIIYVALVIIYQPFLLINMDELSTLRDVVVSIFLCISMVNFPGKNKLEDWLKIPSKTSTI